MMVGRYTAFDISPQEAPGHVRVTIDVEREEALAAMRGMPIGAAATVTFHTKAPPPIDYKALWQSVSEENALLVERLRAAGLSADFSIDTPVSADEHDDTLRAEASALAQLDAAQRALVWMTDTALTRGITPLELPDDVDAQVAKARTDIAEQDRLVAVGMDVAQRVFEEQRALRGGAGETGAREPCCPNVPGHYDDCPNRAPTPHPVPPHTPGFRGVPSEALPVTRPIPSRSDDDAR